MKKLWPLFMLLVLLSCKARKQKEFFRQRAEQDKQILDRIRQHPVVVSPYARLRGEVNSSDSLTVFRYYDLRGIRVYCSFDSTTAVVPKNLLGVGNFGELFGQSLLNGGMFFCPAKTVTPCEVLPDYVLVNHNGTVELEARGLYGFHGPGIQIGSVRVLETSANQRWLEIRAAKLGTDNIDVFFAGLENKSASEKTSWPDFIRGAKLIHFSREYSEI